MIEKRGIKKGITDKSILEYYNRGLHDRLISEILNCSIRNITKRRWKLGLLPNKMIYYISNPEKSMQKCRDNNMLHYYRNIDKNREKYRESRRKYVDKNREKINKDTQKRYYKNREKNREKINKDAQKKYYKNREKILERRREIYKINKR